MKLQKLLYFAHGWHLAIFDAPLLSEKPQAWKYGPVIPSMYELFKEFGNAPILLDYDEISPQGLDIKEETKKFIDSR